MFQQVGGNATGMDCEAVEDVARQIDDKAAQIDDICSQLENQMSGTSWSGPDAEKFASEWQSETRTAFQRLREVLDNQKTTLQRNAQEQREVANS